MIKAIKYYQDSRVNFKTDRQNVELYCKKLMSLIDYCETKRRKKCKGCVWQNDRTHFCSALEKIAELVEQTCMWGDEIEYIYNKDEIVFHKGDRVRIKSDGSLGIVNSFSVEDDVAKYEVFQKLNEVDERMFCDEEYGNVEGYMKSDLELLIKENTPKEEWEKSNALRKEWREESYW
jgi:hypothetical protein